ncbi:hypothetical protein JX265_001044 [Neoarthrinium moseri]|uniref:Uncharacterized protein n=1 Tax=Neoarthrinium moseri TaxID=1658444 RepID=A0A9P9WXG5_9PEZI|nr:uncharacterized protein JN550_004683 [Neoarthrinium moseri]KAI1843750.1 hypothetical protein JX266_010009 [Neoarthrinium moseri]KAI1871238.1 hypothetical protein JN550_004683 [Neoarthrinium moseri]KAI1880804.1 hypothetical protein JX265_001044 [Neoarthrinium moseri]
MKSTILLALATVAFAVPSPQKPNERRNIDFGECKGKTVGQCIDEGHDESLFKQLKPSFGIGGWKDANGCKARKEFDGCYVAQNLYCAGLGKVGGTACLTIANDSCMSTTKNWVKKHCKDTKVDDVIEANQK